jgi:hypothetical protein
MEHLECFTTGLGKTAAYILLLRFSIPVYTLCFSLRAAARYTF